MPIIQGHAWLHRPLSGACWLTALASYSQPLTPANHRLKKLCHPKLSNQPIRGSRDYVILGCYKTCTHQIRACISPPGQTSREGRGEKWREADNKQGKERDDQRTSSGAGDKERENEMERKTEQDSRDKSKAKDYTLQGLGYRHKARGYIRG